MMTFVFSPAPFAARRWFEFLEHLLRHLPGKLLIIWDGLRSHRSRLVWDFVRGQRGRLWLEFLPAYAPELNPVEYLWAHWKQHELPNFCPQNFGQLSSHARRALRRMRCRPTLVMTFWEQAELFPFATVAYSLFGAVAGAPDEIFADIANRRPGVQSRCP
jgi:transposase